MMGQEENGWRRGCLGIGCLEVKDVRWEKACGLGACLEKSGVPGSVLIRNSERPETVISATAEEWERFKQAIKEDRL